MKYEVNALGKQCPIPVVMTKKVIDQSGTGDEIEILVDNETAVNNLSRLANKTGCTFVSEKLEVKKYRVKMKVQTEQTGTEVKEEEFVCEMPGKKVKVAVISADVMGKGDDELGKVLINFLLCCSVFFSGLFLPGCCRFFSCKLSVSYGFIQIATLYFSLSLHPEFLIDQPLHDFLKFKNPVVPFL